MPLTDFQRELCETSEHDFTDLRALFVNCTLKPSPERSHTQGLIDVSVAIMEANGVGVDQLRAVDHDLSPGVYPDMREHGAASDAWPALYERVQAADILVLATPIWLGEKAASQRTATSAPSGTPDAGSTSPTPSIAEPSASREGPRVVR